MQDSDLPETGTASGDLSFEQGVEALEGILDAPEEREPVKGQQSSNQDVPSEPEGEQPEDDDDSPDAEMSDEQPDAEEESDDDQGEEKDEGDSVELSDDLEIELGDGQRATLAQLRESHLHLDKREKDMQRHMTQRTQELSNQAREVSEQGERVKHFANETAQMRRRFLESAQHFLPIEPEMPKDPDDIVAWSEYSRDKAQYDEKMAHYNHVVQQAEAQHQQHFQQHQQVMAQWVQEEGQKFLEAHPELRDQQTFQRVNGEVTNLMKEKYGIEPQELQTIHDSRLLNAMMDLLAHHKGKERLQSSKVTAREKTAGKPKMLASGKARSQKPTNAKRREQANNALRKTGSLEAGIDAIFQMDDL